MNGEWLLTFSSFRCFGAALARVLRSAAARSADERTDVLVGTGDHAYQLTHRLRLALRDELLPQHAIGARDELHDRLVGLDLGERVAERVPGAVCGQT